MHQSQQQAVLVDSKTHALRLLILPVGDVGSVRPHLGHIMSEQPAALSSFTHYAMLPRRGRDFLARLTR